MSDVEIRFRTALSQLISEGKPFTQDDLCSRASMSKKTLHKNPIWLQEANKAIEASGRIKGNPRIKEMTQGHQALQREETERKLGEAIEDLKRQGLKVSKTEVIRIAGISSANLTRNPAIQTMLDEYLAWVNKNR